MLSLAAVPTILLLGLVCLVQEGTPGPGGAGAFKVPDNLMGKSNPVPPTPEGLARAQKMWGYDCAVCHGKTGDGKGDIPMKTPLKDLRDPTSLKGMSDGEIYYIIVKGKGDMPPEEGRGKDDDMWNMVSLVKSFSKS